jgi:phosphoribosylformylglycinamidine synthase
MAAAAGIGVVLDAAGTSALFGEDQSRYLVATNDPETLMAAGRIAKVPVVAVGRFGGDVVRLGSAETALVDLVTLHEGAFAAVLG